jgi:hypothetical protein
VYHDHQHRLVIKVLVHVKSPSKSKPHWWAELPLWVLWVLAHVLWEAKAAIKATFGNPPPHLATCLLKLKIVHHYTHVQKVCVANTLIVCHHHGMIMLQYLGLMAWLESTLPSLSNGHGKLHSKGRFTPRGRANSPWGRLHEISAFFWLEAGLNYTL